MIGAQTHSFESYDTQESYDDIMQEYVFYASFIFFVAFRHLNID